MMTEIEIRVAALEMALTKVGALVDDWKLDLAADNLHASLADTVGDDHAILKRALILIELARDGL